MNYRKPIGNAHEGRRMKFHQPGSPEWRWRAFASSLCGLLLMRINVRFVQRSCGVLTLLGLLAAAGGRAEISVTNQPFPGVSYYTITRTPPPTRMFVAEVDLTNPKVRLRVAPGGADPDGPGPWQTTLLPPTKIAAREGLDLVVNGDFFRARGVKDAEGTNATYRAELWSAVSGPAVSQGTVWSVSPDPRPCLVVNRKGQVAIRSISRPDADDWEVVSGNTLLVTNGVIVPHENQTRHPRTVVGLNAARTRLVLLIVDGRKPGLAVGMNYNELATEMLRLGCHQALNLDGGGSSVMAVRNSANGKYSLLNQPTDGRERPVASVLGVVAGP
jgi:hypothetical protein